MSVSAAPEQVVGQKPQTTSSSPTQGEHSGGANTAQRTKLRGMSFDEGQALLRPDPGTPPDPKKATTQPAPQGDQAKMSDKTRSQILKQRAGDMATLEDLMSFGAFDWAVTDSEATRALALLDKMKAEAPVVIQSMNQKNPTFMKRLVGNAPASAKATYPLPLLQVSLFTMGPAEILAMLAASPANVGITAKVAGKIELGWALQKATPNFVRDMAKGKGNGWFYQWMSWAPEPEKTGVMTLFRQAQSEEKEKQDVAAARKAEETRVMDKFDKDDSDEAKKLRAQVKSIEDLLSYSFTDWAITDGEARKVFGMLTQLSGDKIRYAIMKLDQGPFVDRFIGNLPAADRWNQKKAFLNILAARSPEKNVKYVTELLSYGLFDWAVTDEDARLAFYLVKTMPKDVRDQFKNADGGKWWGRMEGNLDSETKESKDAHFYDNKEEIQTKKLEFQESAQKWPQGQLKMAIEMLVRMGEEDFVEKEIQAKFDKSPEHEWVFSEFGFARTGGTRDPKIWKEFKEKSAGAKFVDTMKAVGSGAKLLGQAIGGGVELGVTGKTDLNLDMQDLQNVMGGDVAGVKFAKNKDDKDNKLGLSVDLDKGLVQVNASSLSIASISTLVDTTRIQTGPIAIENVAIVAKWPTPSDPEQSYTLTIGGIEAKDIWQTSETAMTGVGSVSLKGFSVSAKAPVGEKPKDKTQLIGQALSDIQEAMTRLIGMLDTKDPAPERIGMRVGQSFTGATDAKVSLGALEVKDVVQSAGGHVGEVKAEGLEMSISQSRKGDAVRARLAQLADKEKKGDKLADKELAEKKELEASLPKIAALEKREAELVQKRNDSEKKELDAWEKEELAHIRDQLVVTNAEVGVKALSVKDVDTAGMKAKSLEVTDLKGKVTAERELGREAGAPSLEVAKPGDKKKPDSRVSAEVSVGSMKGQGLVMVGANKLESYERRIAELQAKIDKKEANDEERALLAQLKQEVGPVHTKVIRRDEIKLIPAEKRSQGDKAELASLSKELESWVGRAPDTTIDEISAQGKDGKPALEGKVDVATGKVSVNVADAQVKGVKKGDLELESASMSGLSASADTGGDLRLGGNIAETLTGAEAKVERLDVKGLKMGGTANSVKLQQELEPLALKAKLHADTMTDDEKRRLAELPVLVKAAQVDEARLAELRKAAQDDPATFTPELEQEMKGLADRCDPKVTRVASAEMNHVGVKLDTKAGTIGVEAGTSGKPAVKVEGVEIGQKRPDGTIETRTKVDSAKVETFGANMKAEGGLDKLLDPSSGQSLSADMKMSGVALEGLEMKGQQLSSSLQSEADGLASAQKAGKPLDERQMKRLAELPGLITQARRDETRLIELRRIQKQTPAEFTKDMDWELSALAKRLDPGYQKVAKVDIGEVNASVDTKAGKIELGKDDKNPGVKGLKVEGAELGKVSPDGKLEPQTKVKSAKVDALSASVETDGNAGALFDPTKSDKLKANVEARGIEVEGVESDKMKLDKASLESMSASYDKADGGKAALELQGAKLENFEMHSTKVATLESRMGELLAKARGGVELSKEEKSELDKLKADYQSYQKLKAEYATAKGPKKKQLEGKLKTWEKDQVTSVKSAEMGKLSVKAEGVGDVTKGEVNKGAHVTADLDRLKAQGIQAGDTKLKSASVTGLHAEGSNLLDEEKRSAKVGIKALEAEGLKMPGTVVGKAKVKDVSVGLEGRNLDAKVKQAHVSGVSSGGSNVGYANASGIGVGIRGLGTEKQVTSTSVASFNAGGISTGTKDNGTTIEKVRGGGLSMMSGKGMGGGSGLKLASVDAEGIVNTSTNKETGEKSVASVGTASARGVGLGSGKDKSKSITVDEAALGGVNYSTYAKGAKDAKSVVTLDEAKASGINVGLGADGSMTAGVKSASAKGLGYSDTKVDDKGQTVVTTANVKEASAGDISFAKNGDRIDAGLGHANVKGVSYGATTTDKSGQVTGTKSASVKDAGLNGVTVGMDSKTGDMQADVKGAHVNGVTFDEKDGAGKEKTHASVGSVKVSDIVASGNTKSNVYGAGAGNINVKDIDYRGVDDKGVKTSAKVDGVNVNGAYGFADMQDPKKPTFGGGFKDVTATGVSVEKGEKGKDGHMAINTDKLKAGDGKDFSTVVMKSDGTIDADLKAIELGPNTKGGSVGNVFESTKKSANDPKKLETTSLKLGDEKGQAGKFTVGEVRMRDFNPKDISADKSQLQVFDIGADRFVLNSGTNTVVGKGAKLDSVFMKGKGDGQVMAGYSGFGLDGASVKTDQGTASVKDVKSSGGYAVMNGFKPGQEFGVAYANVKDLTAGEIQADWKLPAPNYEKDKAAHDQTMKGWDKRKPYNANDQQLDLSGLGRMNGKANASYTYNKDDGGFWDEVGAVFVGRSAEANLDIKNGGVDGRTADIGMGEFSLLGTPIGSTALNSFQLGFNTGAHIDKATGGDGMISIPGLANEFGSKSEEKYNTKPDAPKASDYTPDKLREKRDWMTRTNVDVSLTDMGGGTIQKGTDFKGQMDKGGQMTAKGNVGEDLNVTAKNLGFTDVNAMDGQVSMGAAGVKEAEVKITSLGDPDKASVKVKVQGTKISDVQYGQGDGKKLDGEFDEMTRK